MSVYISRPYIRLIHGPLLGIECGKQVVFQKQTHFSSLLCFCSAVWLSDRPVRGGGRRHVWGVTRQEFLRAGASHALKLTFRKNFQRSFKAHFPLLMWMLYKQTESVKASLWKTLSYSYFCLLVITVSTFTAEGTEHTRSAYEDDKGNNTSKHHFSTNVAFYMWTETFKLH